MSRMTNLTYFYTAQKNVTTSGTPVQLASQSVPEGVKVIVKGKDGNTGTITFGFSSADALNTGTAHFKLLPNQANEFQVTNTDLIWIDATVSGEGVEVFF